MSSSFQEYVAAPQPARPGNTTVRPRDELDDLFDYDVDLGGVFGEVDTNMDLPVKQASSSKAGAKDNSIGLGIDEEIKIAKRRRPVAKLDKDRCAALLVSQLVKSLCGLFADKYRRLLSQAGIPKLRRLAKDRLKFKGKGHEVRRTTWQAW